MKNNFNISLMLALYLILVCQVFSDIIVYTDWIFDVDIEMVELAEKEKSEAEEEENKNEKDKQLHELDLNLKIQNEIDQYNALHETHLGLRIYRTVLTPPPDFV